MFVFYKRPTVVGSRTRSLKKPWFGYHYQSTYSNFARGVSILVHKSIPFRLLDLVLDSGGRYVLLHAQVCSMKWVIAGLYLPPPASLCLLNQLTSKIADFVNDNNVILGDFNLVPDPNIDRLSTSGNSHSGLVEWEETYGLTDV